MKRVIRPVAVLCAASFLVACVSPYRAQMDALYNAYRAGNISESEYRREMTRLQVNDAGWQQQNANAATTAAVVGVAAVGAAALLDDNDHHHHHYHHRPYRHW